MKENKNRLEIRLDPESQELLNSLIARTNLTKTSLIKSALKVYASILKGGHIFTIRYKATESSEKKSQNDEIKQEEMTEEDNKVWEEMIEDSKKYNF